MKEKNQKNFSAKLRFAFLHGNSSKAENKRTAVSRQNSFSLPFPFLRKRKKGSQMVYETGLAQGKLDFPGFSLFFSLAESAVYGTIDLTQTGFFREEADYAHALYH